MTFHLDNTEPTEGAATGGAEQNGEFGAPPVHYAGQRREPGGRGRGRGDGTKREFDRRGAAHEGEKKGGSGKGNWGKRG